MTSGTRLPLETIAQIGEIILWEPSCQSMLWACTLVSRAWYSACIGHLYEMPILDSSNFELFVRTICPSKNAHIRACPLASLVRSLDMGELAHDSSRSLMARLIGRLKGNIDEFVAPQVSFSVNSLAALSKCKKLRFLDLKLVSTSIPTKLLFQAIQSLTELESLHFPRSSSNNGESTSEIYTWPPQLRSLYIAGGVNDQFFLSQLSGAPKTLSTLTIRHCPQVNITTIGFILATLGKQLRHLSICHPMPQLSSGMLDNILALCPFLHTLIVSADYISHNLFQPKAKNHPLQKLILECSPIAEPDVTIQPGVISNAINDDYLPNLRSVTVSRRLLWMAQSKTKHEVASLKLLLHSKEIAQPLGVSCGVFLIEDNLGNIYVDD